MKKMQLNVFLGIIFFLIFILLFFKSMFFIDFSGEYFINYSGGIIRRGFLGNILYLIKYACNIIDIYKLLFYLYNLIKIVLFSSLIYYAYKLKIPRILIFSYPILLNGIINSNGRLDYILLVFFIISCVIIKSKLKNKLFLFFIITIMGILIHEVYYFMMILPSIYFYIKSKNKFYIASLIIYTILFLLCVTLFKETKQQVDLVKNNWLLINYIPDLSYYYKILLSDLDYTFFHSVETFNQYVGFLINNILCIILLLTSTIKELKYKEYVYFFLVIILQNLIFLVLCYFANDYSRWYFILFTSIIYFFYFFKQENMIPFLNLKNDNTYFNKIKCSFVIYIPYILYPMISIPFSGWSFNLYYYSLIYFKIKEAFLIIF